MEDRVRLIYVDLDHTLVCVDLLMERLVIGILRNPALFFQAAFWFVQGGREGLKTEMARRYPVHAGHLPYNGDLIQFLQEEKRRGVRLVLATAAPEAWAQAVAQHLALFDRVLATGPVQGNLKGGRKLESILRDAAGEPFGYAGDALVDRPIFEASQLPLVVGGSAALAGRQADKAVIIDGKDREAKIWWKSLRPHQWSKNLLVFSPVVAAHQVGPLGPDALLSFFGFCFVASAFYLLNDLYDVDVDRRHPEKRTRSVASGTLHPSSALLLLSLLLVLAGVIASHLPIKYTIILLCYGAVTCAYSIKIKTMIVLDLVTLAFLYSLRVFAGGAGCGLFVSSWLFSFIFFLALSLAHLKRYVELRERSRLGLNAAARPIYEVEDSPLLMQVGLGSGLISVLVSAFYITSTLTSTLYKTPKLLFLLCLLLFYWIERIWFFANRGKISGDPITFMVKDPVSYAVILLSLLIMWIAAVY